MSLIREQYGRGSKGDKAAQMRRWRAKRRGTTPPPTQNNTPPPTRDSGGSASTSASGQTPPPPTVEALSPYGVVGPVTVSGYGFRVGPIARGGGAEASRPQVRVCYSGSVRADRFPPVLVRARSHRVGASNPAGDHGMSGTGWICTFIGLPCTTGAL